MIKNAISIVLLAVLFTACVNNSLDQPPVKDCSSSTLAFTASTTDATCGQSDGSISVTATEGKTPYSYMLDNGAAQTTGVFENLAPGNYTVTVTDDNTCAVSNEVSVANSGGFQATGTVTDSGCGTNNGTFTVTPTGGTEPYSYSLNGGATQSNAQFTNLAAGQFEVVIEDAAGCDFSVIKTITTGVSYNADVKSIIANSCATTGCHNGTQNPDLRTLADIQASASRVKARTQAKTMPKNGSLTQEQIDIIACWVDDGARDN